MDTLGIVMLLLAIMIIPTAFISLSRLSRHAPKWTVFIICMLLNVLSYVMPAQDIRILLFFTGIMRFIGLFGSIYGVVIICKKS